MNYTPVTAIVRSLDGIDFAVATDQRAIPYEIEFAKAKLAADLEASGDFIRVADAQAVTEAINATGINADPAKLVEPVTEVEALARARARWGRAAYVLGDKP